jgi:hypothetical protein
MGKKKGHQRIWWVNQKDGDHYEKFAVHWMITFGSVLQKYNGACPGLIWLTTGNSGGSGVNSVMILRGPHDAGFSKN